MTENNLLFRRQFVLTPDTCSALDHWQRRQVGTFNLYAHPDVQLSISTSDDTNTTVAIIGYIVDPDCPDRSESDLLNGIVELNDSIDELAKLLGRLSGRFVLIVNTARETFLFHDPCGLRAVYYTRHDGKVFAGSEPYILRYVMPLPDAPRLSSYVDSSYVKANIEHWIPSGCSPFEDVQHLVPNHYLRLSTLEQVRYWPKNTLPRGSVADVVEGASDLLQRLLIAAGNRFELALPLTAGWDSRMLFAASRTFADDIYFYTLQYRDLHSRSHDIRIPRDLLHSLGLRHTVIDCRYNVPEDFADVYRGNSPLAHLNDWGQIAYGMHLEYPSHRVAVKGNCAEIARCFFYKYGTHRQVTSPEQILALVRGWQTVPFIRDQVTVWYDQTIEPVSNTGVDILDLFYWEHRMGSWQAQSQLEWDIVQEVYCPFNHRGLLEMMLGVSPKLRSAPNYELFRRMLNALWPEVTRQPVNPPTPKEQVKNALYRFGLYKLARSAHRRLFRRGTQHG